MLGSPLRMYLFFAQWQGWRRQMIPTAMSALALLPLGPFMSHRSKVKSQIKFLTVDTLLSVEAGRKHLRQRPGKNKDLRRYEDCELQKLEDKFVGFGPMESNSRRGHGTSWTVALVDCYYYYYYYYYQPPINTTPRPYLSVSYIPTPL